MSMKVVKSSRGVHRTVLLTLIVICAFVLSIQCASAQTNPFGGAPAPAMGGIAGWVMAKQALFYRALAGLIRSAKSDGSALWALMGISFVYGIFHAAGPGHGKAVISSYLVANEETWRRGITLSFASSIMQSLTAVIIVSVAAVLLGAGAKVIGGAVRFIEIASYSLIALLGARLSWVKARGFVAAFHARKAAPQSSAKIEVRSHHHCNHRHDHHSAHDGCHGHTHGAEEPDVLPWGHAHGPEPLELAGPGGWRRGLSAIAAVGLRPCSGAIIVLVFALAQGLFWAGILSTLVMGLGTAVTVAAIATLAVGAKALARRIAGKPAGQGVLFLRGVECGAALLVLAFGVLLLTGYLASERLTGF